jgi:hypothetical protein
MSGNMSGGNANRTSNTSGGNANRAGNRNM